MAPRAAQVRGMLLEEALLYLLSRSGYKTITKPGGDPTLVEHGAGIAVRGRGGVHQIDAIADYILQQPFSNPQRLLVEAKFLDKPVGIPIARNAVGVLKDVQEYWYRGQVTNVPKSRYHYTYALFSANGYKKTVQEYAFAQDIYLISLANSGYMQHILRAIGEVAATDGDVASWWPRRTSLGRMRRSIRNQLIPTGREPVEQVYDVGAYVRSCRQLGFALLGLINGRFPILLVPAGDLTLEGLDSNMKVRPRWDYNSWYLFRQTNGNEESKIFSFDLPQELFSMYADDGVLTGKAALNLKQTEMTEIQSVAIVNEEIRVFRFRLDEDWLRDLLEYSDTNS